MAVCTRCHQMRRTVLLCVMICGECRRKEPKANCSVCGRFRRFLTDGSGICPDCVRRATLPATIECTKCGKVKPPAKVNGKYCAQCQKRVNRGVGMCSCCEKEKPYVHKEDKLCSLCNLNRHAGKRLKKFIDTVVIPNEYSLRLFQCLVATINWETVNENVYFRVRSFGKFLQRHHFASPLTWGAIIKLKRTLTGNKHKPVRSCLEQVGELLLGVCKEEDLDQDLRRIKPLARISSLSPNIIALFEKYDLWLRTERMNTPAARRNHFISLGDFWKWCAHRGLTSFADVEAVHLQEYLHLLGLKWKCRYCLFTQKLTTRGETPPTVCENSKCRALNSFEKVIRCVERSVDGHLARFRVFFGWLKEVEEGIEKNPAPVDRRRKRKKKRGRRTRKYPATIQYYDWQIIAVLLKAIEDPTMPAEEAMMLYLLLYHAFYKKELQTVRIPSQCRPPALGVEPRESLEDVLYLEWEPRQLSRGMQSLGRSGQLLQLEPRDEPWLRDLIRRFMKERNQKLRTSQNPYLFIGAKRSPRGGPVSDQHFHRLVESATARITGRICTISILGKCSRLLYAEFGGHEGIRHLRELGLGEQHARVYTWAKRVRVVPKQTGPIQNRYAKRGSPRLTVPSVDIFGIPTDAGLRQN